MPFLPSLALSVAFAFLMTPADLASGAGTPTTGRVTDVTVFQGQALVTRRVEVRPTSGELVEVIVESLPENLLPGSLYAEPVQGCEVRSVRYRVRPIEGDRREEVRALDTQIEELEDQLRTLAAERELVDQRWAYLDSLEGFSSKVAKSDLDRGVLDATTLIELTKFSFDERQTVVRDRLRNDESKRKAEEQLVLLRKQRATLTSASTSSSREAVVFLSAVAPGEGVGRALAGPVVFRLSYLVSGASWSPSYNLRASEDMSEVLIEYNASVVQRSGEDWRGVKMTLSTASPSFVAKAPDLEPLQVSLASPQRQKRNQIKSKSELNFQQRAVASNRGVPASQGITSFSEIEELSINAEPVPNAAANGGFGSYYADSKRVDEADKTLNRMAGSLQLYEFNYASNSGKKEIVQPTTEEAGISVVYELANRTSLPSRPDRQLIQIASVRVDAESYRVATPVLTDFVYREARLENDTDRVLLAGPAATFVGDRFVGRGEVPSVAVGEPLTLGLGIDESLRVQRELVNREERLQGANRIVTFNYKITLENYGAEPVAVRLLDRMPKATGSALKATLLDCVPALSEEQVYRRSDYDQGILRWDLDVPAEAIGAKAEEVSYTLQIEHDKTLEPVGGAK